MIDALKCKLRALRARFAALRYRNMKLQDVFEEIYGKRMWGGNNHSGSFNSGSGSDGTASRPYVEAISRYIQENGIQHVVDLGCGDFRVGSAIVAATDVRYKGVDITRSLIAHLNANVARPGVEFQCLNIVDDPLPEGDLYLIRQVLQHLSNRQIAAILEKLRGTDAIVTEHVPTDPCVVWNKDKSAGPDIRLYRKSGVFLEHPPFCLSLEPLLEVPQPFNGVDAVLRTSLIRARQAP